MNMKSVMLAALTVAVILIQLAFSGFGAVAYCETSIKECHVAVENTDEVLRGSTSQETEVVDDGQFTIYQVDGPTPYRMIGLSHTPEVLARHLKRFTDEVDAADVILLEQSDDRLAAALDLSGKKDDFAGALFFSQVAGYAVSKGKKVFFIDTRGWLNTAITGQLMIWPFLVSILVIGGAVISKRRLPSFRVLGLLFTGTLIAFSLGFPTPLQTASYYLGLGRYYQEHLADFEVSNTIDGFTVLMDDNVGKALSHVEAQHPLVVVGGMHAFWHEAYRKEHPMLFELKHPIYHLVYGLLGLPPREVAAVRGNWSENSLVIGWKPIE